MKVIFNITENKNKATFQQEVVKINTSFNQTQNIVKPKFQTGYYPLTGGGGGDLSNYYTKDETYSKTEVDDIIADIPVVDTSNLVPYTGATQDVNIGDNLFESAIGFKLTDGEQNQYLMADGSVSTLINPITGTGTTNYIPKFSASGTLANSIVYDNGTSVSIGDTISDARLRVKAQGTNATDIAFRVRNSANTQDFLVVNGAGDVYNKGALGESTNLFFGENIGRVANGVGNVGFGSQSLRLLSTGTFNSSFGYQALISLTTGIENTAIGQASLQLISNSSQNTAIGRASMPNLTSGNQNTSIGNNSGRFIADGTTNLSSSTLSLFLGFNAKSLSNNQTNEIVIGANAIGNGSNTATIGNDSTTSVYLKGIAKSNGFKTPTGIATQSLTANGGTFDLTTKADLVSGKVPASQSRPSTMVMDNSTYVITFTDATGAVQTIDLPLESLFQDANYNSATKTLVVTLKDGTTKSIPLSDLVDLPEIVLSTANPAVTPTSGQKVYFNTSLGKVWFNVGGAWVFGGNLISDSEKTNLSTAYNHSQATGNVHNTKVEELTDVGSETTTIADTDVILKKESGGFWKKISFANFKSWFTTELAKKINIGLDTVFNFKNISAMPLTDFRSITPNIETIYFTEEQNGTGWQQVRYNGLGITIPATTETVIALTNENFIELDSDSTFNLINVANTKINGIFEKDFVIIKFNAGVVTPATANQWFKVILKINGVQTAVSPVFYLTESSGTVEQIAHNFALNVPTEMVTNGATLHLKTSAAMTFNNPAISVARVHKSTNANL